MTRLNDDITKMGVKIFGSYRVAFPTVSVEAPMSRGSPREALLVIWRFRETDREKEESFR